MARVKYSPEQIIIKLQEVEVLCRKGSSIAEAARQSGVTEQINYR
jgi:transposase-like protein